jgi:hypothetical protein
LHTNENKRLYGSTPNITSNKAQQKKLDQDVAAFLKAGGEIQYIPVGETRDFGINDNDYKKVLRGKQNN